MVVSVKNYVSPGRGVNGLSTRGNVYVVLERYDKRSPHVSDLLVVFSGAAEKPVISVV